MPGRRFGRLKVLKHINNNKDGKRLWLCQCDCGETTVAVGNNLRHGGTRSCGCLKIEVMSLPKGKAAFNLVFRSYTNSARQRGYSFKLSKKKRVMELTQQDCTYCGTRPEQIMAPISGSGDFVYNGIDRMDNAKGYVRGNVVACCGVCNLMKKADSQEEFLAQVKKIYKHSMKVG